MKTNLNRIKHKNYFHPMTFTWFAVLFFSHLLLICLFIANSFELNC